MARSICDHCFAADQYRLDDRGLEPTHVLVGVLPVKSTPVQLPTGSWTNSRSCRHLLCLLCPFAPRSRQERPDGRLRSASVSRNRVGSLYPVVRTLPSTAAVTQAPGAVRAMPYSATGML